jgi:hypothetical protein
VLVLAVLVLLGRLHLPPLAALLQHAALLCAASPAIFHENNAISNSAPRRKPSLEWYPYVLPAKPPASVVLFSAREFLPRTVTAAVVVPTTAVVVALPVLKCGGLGALDPSGTSLSCALAVRSLVQLVVLLLVLLALLLLALLVRVVQQSSLRCCWCCCCWCWRCWRCCWSLGTELKTH